MGAPIIALLLAALSSGSDAVVHCEGGVGGAGNGMRAGNAFGKGNAHRGLYSAPQQVLEEHDGVWAAVRKQSRNSPWPLQGPCAPNVCHTWVSGIQVVQYDRCLPVICGELHCGVASDG